MKLNKLIKQLSIALLIGGSASALHASQILIQSPYENEVVSLQGLNVPYTVSINLDFFAQQPPTCELDGTDLGLPTQSPASPNFNYTFNPLNQTNGAHTIVCRGTEPSGNVVSAVRHFTIDNSGNNWSQYIIITAPNSGDTVTGMTRIEAQAHLSMPTNVQFFLDDFSPGNLLGTGQWMGSSGPNAWDYYLMKNLSQYTPGRHLLLVRSTYSTGHQETNYIIITIGDPKGPPIKIMSPLEGSIVDGRMVVYVDINTIPAGPVSLTITEALSGRSFTNSSSFIDPVTGFTGFVWEAQDYLNGQTRIAAQMNTAAGVVSDAISVQNQLPQNHNYFNPGSEVTFSQPDPGASPAQVIRGIAHLAARINQPSGYNYVQYYARLSPDQPLIDLGTPDGQDEIDTNLATLPVGAWNEFILVAKATHAPGGTQSNFARLQVHFRQPKPPPPPIEILTPATDEHVPGRYVVTVNVNMPYTALHAVAKEALSDRLIDLGNMFFVNNIPAFVLEAQDYLDGPMSITVTADTASGPVSAMVNFVNDVPQNYNFFDPSTVVAFSRPAGVNNPAVILRSIVHIAAHPVQPTGFNYVQYYARLAPNQPLIDLGAPDAQDEIDYNMATLPVGAWDQFLLIAKASHVPGGAQTNFARMQVKLKDPKIDLPDIEIITPQPDEHVTGRYVAMVRVNVPYTGLHAVAKEALSDRVIDLGQSFMYQNNPSFVFEAHDYLNGQMSITVTADTAAGPVSATVKFVNDIPQNHNFFDPTMVVAFSQPNPANNPAEMIREMVHIAAHTVQPTGFNYVQYYARLAPNQPLIDLGAPDAQDEIDYNLATLPVGAWNQFLLIAKASHVPAGPNTQTNFARVQVLLKEPKVQLPPIEIIAPQPDEHVPGRYVAMIRVNLPYTGLHAVAKEALSNRLIDLGQSFAYQGNIGFVFEAQEFLNGPMSITFTADTANGPVSAKVDFVNDIVQNYNYYNPGTEIAFTNPSGAASPAILPRTVVHLAAHINQPSGFNYIQYYARLAPGQALIDLGAPDAQDEIDANLATLPVGAWDEFLLIAKGSHIPGGAQTNFGRLQVHLRDPKVSPPDIEILTPQPDEHVTGRFVVNVRVNKPYTNLRAFAKEAESNRIVSLGASGMGAGNIPYFVFEAQYFLNGKMSITVSADSAGGTLTQTVNFVNDVPQNYGYFQPEELITVENPYQIENGPVVLLAHFNGITSMNSIQFQARLAPDQTPTNLGVATNFSGQFRLPYDISTLPVGAWKKFIIIAAGTPYSTGGTPQYSRYEVQLIPPSPQKPRVVIVSPTEGQTVQGTIAINVNINFTPQKPSCTLDGVQLGDLTPAVPAPPNYTMQWNTTGVANGVHTLVCGAIEPGGQWIESIPVHVNVYNAPVQKPLVIVKPKNESVVSGRVLISAVAYNPSIYKVVWQLDTAYVLNQVGQSPFNATWNTRQTPNGKHKLKASGFTSSGVLIGADEITVYVKNGGLPGRFSMSAAQGGNNAPDGYEFTNEGVALGFGAYTGTEELTEPYDPLGKMVLGDGDINTALQPYMRTPTLEAKSFEPLRHVTFEQIFNISDIPAGQFLILEIPGAASSAGVKSAAATGKLYMLNSNGSWTEVPSSGGVMYISQSGLYAYGTASSSPDEFAVGEVYTYPNPAVGVSPTFHGEFGDADSVTIEIFDESGAKVATRELSGPPAYKNGKYAFESVIDRSGLASGMYYAVASAKKVNFQTIFKRIRFAIVR